MAEDAQPQTTRRGRASEDACDDGTSSGGGDGSIRDDCEGVDIKTLRGQVVAAAPARDCVTTRRLRVRHDLLVPFRETGQHSSLGACRRGTQRLDATAVQALRDRRAGRLRRRGRIGRDGLHHRLRTSGRRPRLIDPPAPPANPHALSPPYSTHNPPPGPVALLHAAHRAMHRGRPGNYPALWNSSRCTCLPRKPRRVVPRQWRRVNVGQAARGCAATQDGVSRRGARYTNRCARLSASARTSACACITRGGATTLRRRRGCAASRSARAARRVG